MTIIRWWDLIRCRFPAPADPVVKGAYCNVIFMAPVSICHAALSAFIDKPDLFRHRNTGFASTEYSGAFSITSPVIGKRYSG